MLKIKKLSRG